MEISGYKPASQNNIIMKHRGPQAVNEQNEQDDFAMRLKPPAQPEETPRSNEY